MYVLVLATFHDSRLTGVLGMSASWDSTLRLWDIQAGQPLGVMQEKNKARGFALYKDNTRAVSTGSGLCLSIWDIENVKTPRLLNRLDTGHTSTVWGLELLYQQPFEDTRCITFASDGTLRVWNLADDEEHEEVSGRRAFDPGPMCAASIPAPGNYVLGNTPIVVGLTKNSATNLGAIKLVDVSNLGSGPSSSALVLGMSCVSMESWTQWLLDAMDEDEGANVLFLRDDTSEFPTLVHTLAARPDGAGVLKQICKKYEHESAVGLVSHAGSSPHGNALEIAITYQHEDTANVLLEDYSRHVEESTYDLIEDHLLSEHVAVRLFEAFPGVATRFLMTVELCRKPGLLQQGSRCDFSVLPYAELVRSHASSTPVPKTGGSLWWDKKLDKRWKQTGSSAPTRADDTAYGERAEAKMIPFVCTKFSAANRAASSSDQDEAAQRRLPFSCLLEQASAHADDNGPAIFESEVLRIIVQLKWEESCRLMHMIQFYAFLIFLVVYACCTLLYAKAVNSDDQVTTNIVWGCWGYSCLYTVLLGKREVHQMMGAWRSVHSSNICTKVWVTLKGYFDLWNLMDLVNLGAPLPR